MPRDYGVCRVCGNRIYGDDAVTDWEQAPKDAMYHWKSHVPKRDWPQWTYAAADARKARQAVQEAAHAAVAVMERPESTDLEERRAGLDESYESMIAAFETPRDVEFVPEVVDPAVLAKRAALDAEFEALATADLPPLMGGPERDPLDVEIDEFRKQLQPVAYGPFDADGMMRSTEELSDGSLIEYTRDASGSVISTRIMPVSEGAAALGSRDLPNEQELDRSQPSETGHAVKVACGGCGKLCAPGAGLAAHMRRCAATLTATGGTEGGSV
jgi:hypothetical protein